MQKLYIFGVTIFFFINHVVTAQCPPPGFPEPGNNCPDAPVLCQNIDGYCATVNNNNVVQNFPGCPANVLNNDEWFAFFAGTTSITIQITPSNCQSSGNQGLQGGIYGGCISNIMDTQCQCEEDPFILTSSNFVVGEIYWLVIDGCAGNVCDYSVAVLNGSTVPFPPGDPGPITGPTDACVDASDSYSILPPNGATEYTWTLDPPLGTMTGGNDEDVNINWGSTAGTTDLCVQVGNFCETNPNLSCITIEVHPEPTATLSGSGKVCEQGTSNTPVELSIAFTGDSPWTFSLNTPNGPMGPITTTDNPYVFTVTDPGAYSLQNNLTSSDGDCPGMVSGNVNISETEIDVTGTPTTATCMQSNGSIDVTGASGGTPPYTFEWSNGEMTEDLTDVPSGSYTVTATDANGCEGTATFMVAETANEPTVTASTTPSECGLDNGSIDVSVSGGASPYTYVWGGGETTEDLDDIPAGNYSITVTGADGCTTVLSIDLANDDPPINITATIVANTTCMGGNGSITTTVSPQPAPGGGTYTYQWGTGETTPDLVDVPAGSYTVTVSTGNSCSGTATFVIPDEPDEPMVNFTTTDEICGLGNGAIDVSVSGGVAPYTFMWGGGETTEDINNIPAGTYSVTVTGANGCTGEASIAVANNEPPITVTANISPNEGCGPGNWDGEITITISPAVSPSGDPYVINWNTGETTTTISNLDPSSSYTVTVNGGGTCETIQTFNVPNQPNPPQISQTVDPAECGLSNGSATINVSGGVQPYVIMWSNGNTTNTITDVPGGSYSVTVTGANGCSADATVNIPDNPIVFNVTSVIEPNSACDPMFNDGSITITILPTTNNYTITWSTGDTGTSITGLGGGSYSVTVNAGGDCEQVFPFNVPNIPAAPVITLLPQNAECGESNGTVFIQTTGAGVFPFTYIWSNGQTTQTLNNVPAGNYSVTVTGANGCSTTGSTNVGDDDIPINLTADVVNNTSCLIPGMGNGSINLNINTTGNPVITWSNGASGTSLTDLDPGTYTVTVSVGGNCEEVLPITIIDESEIPNLSIIQTPALCGLPDGEADLTVVGGTQPYTFFWDNGATTEDLIGVPAGPYSVTVTTATGCTAETFVNINENSVVFNPIPNIGPNISCGNPDGYIQLTVVPQGNYTYQWDNGETLPYLTDLAAGIYTVTITAAGNCFAVFPFEVTDQTLPPSLSTTATAATCGLQNGSVDLSITGGSSPFIYQWSNGATTEDLTGVAPGTYNVLVTDAYLCIGTAQVTVGNNNVPINISGTTTANTTCNGNNGGVNISVTPAGNYTINWSNGETTEDLTNVAGGTYVVTVSSGGNCQSTASFTVQNQVEDPDISQTITAAICGEANGAIDLTISGATTPYSFEWSNGATTEDLSGLLPGSYTVTVTAGNSCTSVQTFNVANNSSSFSLSGVETPLTSCVSTNGAIDLTINPAGTYTIEWSNNETTEDLSNLPAGTYVVTVTESGSCSASATFVIEDETSSPEISQTISPEICGQENGSFDITVMGGTMPYTFAWSNGETTEDLIDVASDIYTVTVTGANGCSAETTAEVPDNSISFSIQGTPSANTSCGTNNGAIDISVTPAGNYTYVWSNGEITEDINGLAGGGYSVVVSAGGDCSASANFNVPSTTEDPVLSQTIAPSVCGEANGGIDLTVTGGQAPYTYLWSNGETTEDLTGLIANTYSVEVVGANGCAANANFTVPNNSISINVTGTTQANNSCDMPNGSVSITANPASTTYTYLWSNGATTQNVNGLPPGNYSVTVFEGATCQASANFNVGNNTNAPDISSSILDAVCGEPNGGIDLSAAGGTMPYTFLWSNGEITEDLSGVLPGDYDVTVTGADGCSNTGSYTINDDLINIEITGTPVANTACLGGNGSIALDVMPVGTYTFAWSNGETTQDLSGLLPGNFEVTVTASGSCSSIASFQIADNPELPTITNVVTASICGQPDGAIDISPTGGIPPYTFEWSNGELSEDLINILSGAYAVTVTDAVGCTVAGNFNVANNSNTFTMDASTSANTLCAGANGSIDLQITPVGTYTIIWSNGATTEDLTDVPSGTYTVTVTDSGTCSASGTYVVDNDAPTVNVSGTATDILCFGENTGEISVNATGGVEPYLYDWSPAIPGSPSDPNGLMAGDYTVIVTDASGCSGEANFTINQPTDAVQLACIQTVTVSGPGMMDGEAAVNIVGGTAPYVISWAPGGSQDNVPSGNFTLDNLAEGVYDVLVVDANGCETTCGFTINANGCEDLLAAIAMPEPITCIDPQVELVGSSSLPNSSFAWSTLNGQIVGNTNTATILVNEAGDYTLIVGSNGCFDTAFVNVIDLTADLTANITATPTEILDCTIDAINLMGSVIGTTSANYVWSLNNQTISTNQTITVDEGGTYVLTVTDPISGCTDVTEIIIDDNSDFPPLAVDAPPTLNCIDTVGTLSGSSSVNNVDFFWATINGTDTTIIGTGPDIQVNTPGTYYFIGVATNDCTNAISVEVTGDINPPSANAGNDQSLDCYLTPVDLTGSSTTPNVDYFWTVNDPNIIIGNPNAATITVGAPGVYTLTVTQLDNNCQATDQVIVDLYENVPQADIDANAPDCFGDNDGSILVEADPANGPYEYTLNGISNGDNNFFAPLGPGNYELVVTDAQGCTWSTLVYLPEAQPVLVDLGADIIVELGDVAILQAQYTVPTNQLDTILWSPSELFPCPQMPCDVMEITPFQQTSVEVTVIDTNGCEGSDILALFVSKDRQIFIPNAFSPNGDGTNDVFMIFSDNDVLQIKSFMVFSRWGETVYEYYDFVPNNPAFGWDGRHRGELLNPAVFAWFAEVEFIDGQTILFEGDVTLMR